MAEISTCLSMCRSFGLGISEIGCCSRRIADKPMAYKAIYVQRRRIAGGWVIQAVNVFYALGTLDILR